MVTQRGSALGPIAGGRVGTSGMIRWRICSSAIGTGMRFGHGVSAIADAPVNGVVSRVRTCWLPRAEVRLVRAAEVPAGSTVGMGDKDIRKAESA